MDINLMCRSCLTTEKDLINLISSKYDDNLNFWELFIICTSSKTEQHKGENPVGSADQADADDGDTEFQDGNNIAKALCEECFNELKIAYNFRLRCEKSSELINAMIKQYYVKNENSENVYIEFAPQDYENGQTKFILSDEQIEILSDTEIEGIKSGFNGQTKKPTRYMDCKDKNTTVEPNNELNANLKDELEIEVLSPNKSASDNGVEILEDLVDDNNQYIINDNNGDYVDVIEDEDEDQDDQDQISILQVENINSDSDECSNPDQLDDKHDQEDQVFKISLEIETEKQDFNNTIRDTNQIKERLRKFRLECEICKKGFSTKISLEKHMLLSHINGKTNYLCNVCGKLCSQESALKQHLLQHQGNRPYKCLECNRSYFTKNGLQSHQVIHAETKPEAKFLCSVCGKGFSTNQRLIIHTYTHTGERNFSCDLCDKSFATEFRLRTHYRTHTGERPYQCQVCGLTFAQNNALKCHKRVHTGEKPYECKFCGKRFSQNTILKTHLTLHTGKTVKCPDCDKKFSRASYLILHRREHTGEKPYACERCPNKYKQKSHLDRHMDTHLGIRHKCHLCNKEYSKQWSLKMHMFTHTGDKPFKCTECCGSFVRKDKYKLHLRLHHGLTLDDLKDEKKQYMQIHVLDNSVIPPTNTTTILKIVDDEKAKVKNASPLK